MLRYLLPWYYLASSFPSKLLPTYIHTFIIRSQPAGFQLRAFCIVLGSAWLWQSCGVSWNRTKAKQPSGFHFRPRTFPNNLQSPLYDLHGMGMLQCFITIPCKYNCLTVLALQTSARFTRDKAWRKRLALHSLHFFARESFHVVSWMNSGRWRLRRTDKAQSILLGTGKEPESKGFQLERDRAGLYFTH